MVDILERLQSQRTSLGTLWPEPNLHEEAAEKIIQLRKELDETKRAADAFVENEHLREENERLIRENKVAFEAVGGVVKANDKLKEENARLREALQPFSKNYWADDWHDGSDCEINVQLRDIRRAASLVDGYVWTPDE